MCFYINTHRGSALDRQVCLVQLGNSQDEPPLACKEVVNIIEYVMCVCNVQKQLHFVVVLSLNK